MVILLHDAETTNPSFSSTRSNFGSQDEYNTSSTASNNSPSYNQDQSSQNDTSVPPPQDQDYPEQRHAGAVGYGPQYHSGPSVGEKLTGFKEQLKGKMTKNEDLVEQGRERRAGELKRKQEQEQLENNDPFKEPGEKTDSTSPTASSTADAPEPRATSAFGSENTSAPPQPELSIQRDSQGREIAEESGSGMAKPRDVKMIDESGRRRGDEMEGREPGDIGREAVDSLGAGVNDKAAWRNGIASDYDVHVIRRLQLSGAICRKLPAELNAACLATTLRVKFTVRRFSLNPQLMQGQTRNVLELLEENARLLSRIQKLEEETGQGKDNPSSPRSVRIKKETTIPIEPGLKQGSLVEEPENKIKAEIHLNHSTEPPKKSDCLTPLKNNQVRAFAQQENKTGIPRRRAPVFKTLHVARRPGDTESEGEKDIKPKIECNDDDIQITGMTRAIPADYERKPKIKLDMDLDEVTVQTRLRGFDIYPVTLDSTCQWRAFSRRFISSVFGGGLQDVFPRIGGSHLARHGRTNWMFLNNCTYQPNAPNGPGKPGLFYDSLPFSPDDQDDTIQHFFFCLGPNEWLYAGDYQMFVAESLTQTEWVMQTPSFKSRWANALHKDGWGKTVRVMIHLRQRLGREPTNEEISAACAETNSYHHTTAEMIEEAFNQGSRYRILALKCVGYDETLQKELIDRFPTWNPPPPSRSKGKKGKNDVKLAAVKKVKGKKKSQTKARLILCLNMPKFEDEDEAPNRPSSSSRRETILSLVEMLLKQGDASDSDYGQQPIFEDDRDVPTVDEHIQTAGAEAFHRFQKCVAILILVVIGLTSSSICRRINNLDKELRNFANAARQLGSSAAILASAFHLRTRIAHILHLYRLNAADLYPRKVKLPASMSGDADDRFPRKSRKSYRSSRRPRVLPHVARPTVDTNIDLEEFPSQFQALAREVTTFATCLNEFPDFIDDAVNASISSFEGDLNYWADCLQNYRGQFRYPAVQRYIQDLSSEMGEHLDSITTTLSLFTEVNIPYKHGASNLLNLSTIATFFSAVTATTLQFSYVEVEGTGAAVNSFWFASLVFSIAAAVNSLMGLTWKSAMYPPGSVVGSHLDKAFTFDFPGIVGRVLLYRPLSLYDRITSAITTVFTAFSSFGLLAVSAWFASERWAYVHHSGTKWFGDILGELNERLLQLRVVSFTRRSFRWSSEWASKHVSRASTKFRRVKSITKSIISSDGEKGGDIENGLPLSMSTMEAPVSPLGSSRRRPSETGPSSPLVEAPATSPSAGPATPTFANGFGLNSSPASPSAPSVGRQLWKNALRTVKMSTAMTVPARSPRRQRTTSSTMLPSDRKRAATDPPVKAIVRSRVTALVPKLKCLQPTQDVAAHQALVRHLQFSPNEFESCSWDRTSVIFRVQWRQGVDAGGSPTPKHRVPSTDHLLAVQDGVCQRTIDRQTYVESITWFPGGEAFLSVEGSHVAKLEMGKYDFGSMKLQDVAVTPDGMRLLGVGPLLQSPEGLQPSRSRVEKRLTVYNMETSQMEHTTPVLNDVRDITLARNTRNGPVALVSYENKAPPQLWKLDIVKDVARLTLRHTYMPKTSVDFAGPSYFGGKNDELVLCAGKAGDIHIWDQESGALLHHVRAQDLGGDLTCIAWNHAVDNPFMFATGSHDGAVRLWTKPEYPEESDEQQLRSSPTILENNLPFTRSSSPSDMEELQRTESPLAQVEFESSFANSRESFSSGPSSFSVNPHRVPVVAFAVDSDGSAA
ncbi:hypothetical protein D9757_003981 [Collybiopsis confluens]|uniref:DUF6697 domain-containing protein n=1 Tax=Collybiopsis confluens TaxID=2823264 RepID=A0A8H5MEQ9_9AGAR|nr:hypothetical protein D9757_003981 [Collybiopsis confluens]